MNIPKIIHFIWAGGTRYMPPIPNIEIVNKWRTANPDFNIYIWIDKGNRESYKKQVKHYAEEFYEHCKGEKPDFDDTEACEKYLKENKIFLKDITEEAVIDKYIRYEIDRLRPNYGASSDLLRYRILYKFGGAYFDSDVPPGDTNLLDSHLFSSNFKEHRLHVDGNSQGTGKIGNDAFICTKENPVMLAICEEAKKRYTSIDIVEEKTETPQEIKRLIFLPRRIAYNYDKNKDIRDGTIYKTGPGCVRYILNNSVVTKGIVITSALSEKNITKVTMGENKKDWLEMPIAKNQDPLDCLRKILKTIIFEANIMKVLRLDDHISNYIEATGLAESVAIDTILGLLTKPTRFAKRFLLLQKDISNFQEFKLEVENFTLDFIEINALQLTYRFQKSAEYIAENNLLEKTHLFPLSLLCSKLNFNHYGYYQDNLAVIFQEEDNANISLFLNHTANQITLHFFEYTDNKDALIELKKFIKYVEENSSPKNLSLINLINERIKLFSLSFPPINYQPQFSTPVIMTINSLFFKPFHPYAWTEILGNLIHSIAGEIKKSQSISIQQR